MNPKIGKIDRMMRLIMGGIFMVLKNFSANWWVFIIGLVLVISAVMRWLPLYKVFKIQPDGNQEKHIIAGCSYGLIGIVALILSKGLNGTHLFENTAVLWCIAWSGIGIGAGLINIRDHEIPSSAPLHFIGYYGFVLLVVSLFSFTVVELRSESWFEVGVKFKALAALIGLIGGFLGNVYNLSKKWLDK